LKGGSVALRAAAAAFHIGSDCGGVRDGTDENLTICPSRQSGQYQPVWSIPNDATSFLGQHISATFELRAGVVKAEARRVERSESLDDVEHSSTLIM
jgi:hypothetical protein